MGFWRRLVGRWQALTGMARALVIAAAMSVALCVTGALALPGYAAREVAERARGYGFTVELGRARLGWGRLWLHDLSLRDPELPGTRAHVAALAVRVTWSSGLALSVHGAEVEVVGSEPALLARLRKLRGPERAGAPSGAQQKRRLEFEGVGLRWQREAGRVAQLWGLRGHQGNDGSGEVTADLARVASKRGGGDLRAIELAVEAASGERRVARFEAAQVALRLELAAADEEPPGAAAAKAAAMDEVDAEAASSPWAVPWSGLKTAFQRLTTEDFRSSVIALSVETRRGQESLRVGPSRFALKRQAGGVAVEIVPHAASTERGTALTIRARLPLDGRPDELELSGGPVSLATLGVREGDFGLVGVKDARLEAEAHLAVPSDGAPLSISSKGALENVRLRRAALAPNELSGIRLGWRLDGSVGDGGASWSIRDAELSLGDVRLGVSGKVVRRAEHSSAELAVEVPLASCGALLAAVPRGMAPLLEGVRIEGTFALKGGLTYDSEKPLQTRTSLEVKNQCRIAEAPAAIAPRRFTNPWVREVKGADGLPIRIQSGPGTPDWTPYEGISPFLETAVVVCEDAGFFSHRGIDYRAIENSIRQNLEVGRFLRGGSTVSMQLAKNLYLGKEKTLSRKLQEAVLTLLLEQQLSKHELMELYLNVVEFGPGIYGVRQAARYYFNEEPRALSLGQALYLGSILPAPDRQHFRPDGRVSERWAQYLKKLMQVARKIRRVSEDELAAGLSEEVVFREPSMLAREAPTSDETTSDETTSDETTSDEPPEIAEP